MAATQSDIRSWLEHGKELGATHMLVVCDRFDWEDYPVYVFKENSPNSVWGQVGEVRKIYDEYNGKEMQKVLKEMQKVMEVYSFNHDADSQLQEFRAFHFD